MADNGIYWKSGASGSGSNAANTANTKYCSPNSYRLSIGRKRRGLFQMVIRSISCLRGVAALSVLLYHAAYYSSKKTGWMFPSEIFGNQWGLYGVTVFFIISGYLMSKLVQVNSFKSFLAGRFLRIYPMFLLAVAVALFFRYVATGSVPGIQFYQIVLLPMGKGDSVLHVEWTLRYEIFYYVLVSIFCLPTLKRLFPAFTIAWLMALLVAWFGFAQFGTALTPTLGVAILSIWNMGFVVGALMGAFSLEKRSNGYIAFLGLILLLCSEFHGNLSRHVLIPVGLCMIFSWLLKREADGGDIPLWKPFGTLGDWSYGIYLLHVPTILLVIQIYDAPKSPAILWSTLVGCSLLVGSMVGQIDVALHRFLKLQTRQQPAYVAAE